MGRRVVVFLLVLSFLVTEALRARDTPSMADWPDTALDSIFGRRGAYGVTLILNHVSSSIGDLKQIAQRLRNNQIPLILINPPVDRVSKSHPLRSVAPTRYYDFHNPSLDGAWRHYRRQLDGHYTAVFQSTLSYHQSNEWYPYELIFQWYNSTFRYDGAFIIP